MYDTQWGMPGVGWAQQGSFLDPATPPLDPPDGGTLVSLGCVNKDWVKLIVGALDQLRNPSSWLASLDDAGRAEVLNRVDKLLGMITGMDACVNPVINIALDCTNGLQYQTADGIWHVGTNMADICACTTACIVNPVPPNPLGNPTNQHACNIAGYLATDIIQIVMQKLITFAQTESQEANFANSILQDLSFAFPITALFASAADAVFQHYISGVIGEYTSAATDPALWSAVTCAIYSAIKTDGYITAGNYGAVQANVCAISYAHPDIIAAICGFIQHIGLVNLQALQSVGALDDVDCSACGSTWCYEWDFRTAAGPTALYPGAPMSGVYAAGVGWEGTVAAGIGYDTFQVYLDLGVPHFISTFKLWLITPNTKGTATREVVFRNGTPTNSTGQLLINLGSVATPNPGSAATLTVNGTYRYAVVVFGSNPGAAGIDILQSIEVAGTGPNPYGADNCTY